MAVARGFFDDSQSTGRVWALGGYIGGFHDWNRFEPAWDAVMGRHGVPYFHMKEMARPNGVYAKWHPPREHRDDLKAFFADMVAAIHDSGIVGFCSIVRLSDLEKYNSDFGLNVQPYPLAVYGCMTLLAKYYTYQPIELIYDHVEKIESKLAVAREYASSDPAHPDVFEHMMNMPLSSKITWREITALQAADFFSWEFRRSHLDINEWFELPSRPEEEPERWAHFQQWSIEKFGQSIPVFRKSADALLGNPSWDYLIWDRKNLMEAHELRNGKWPS